MSQSDKKKPLTAFTAPNNQIKLDPKEFRTRYFDRTSPTSLFLLTPDELHSTMEEVLLRMPRLVMQHEAEIRRVCNPTPRDDYVRLNFWDEYNKATSFDPPKKMTWRGILCNAITREAFEATYLGNRHKMIWLITPPKSYADTMKRILHRSLDKLTEVLEQPIINAAGELDHKLIDKIIKIAQIADQRVKGAIPQFIHQKNLNMNLNGNVMTAPANHAPQIGGATVSDLIQMPLEQLEALQKKTERLAMLSSRLPGADQIDIINVDTHATQPQPKPYLESSGPPNTAGYYQEPIDPEDPIDPQEHPLDPESENSPDESPDDNPQHYG